MTLVVETPPTYEPERRYLLGVVLGDWLGLDWELRPGDRSDVRVTLAGAAAGAARRAPRGGAPPPPWARGGRRAGALRPAGARACGRRRRRRRAPRDRRPRWSLLHAHAL